MTDTLHSRATWDLAPPDIQAYLESNDTVLVPMGSVEMHGYHLPTGTDIFNAMEVCRRTAEKANVLYTPPMWTGYSPQHLREPNAGMGTLTFRPETIRGVIHDVTKSLIHHGFNRIIFVNGHTSNTKVVDEVFRQLRYETGALVGMFKPYGERYLGIIEDLMENTPEETAGWHASEQETSIMMAFNPDNVKMDRAVEARAHAPEWLPSGFKKDDANPDAAFKGYEYFYFPMDHNEIAEHGVIGNPFRATAEKGDAIFERFSDYLADALEELKTVPVKIIEREYIMKV